MKRTVIAGIVAVFAAAMLCFALAGCGGGDSTVELKDTREISFEGTELTVTVGTNKGTGCEWSAEFGDDSIIDYSINRKFKLSDEGLADGEAYGTSAIGFKGKAAGTTTITLSTPVDWDGNEPGYTYVVTVTVNDDGTIASAEGE